MWGVQKALQCPSVSFRRKTVLRALFFSFRLALHSLSLCCSPITKPFSLHLSLPLWNHMTLKGRDKNSCACPHGCKYEFRMALWLRSTVKPHALFVVDRKSASFFVLQVIFLLFCFTIDTPMVRLISCRNKKWIELNLSLMPMKKSSLLEKLKI